VYAFSESFRIEDRSLEIHRIVYRVTAENDSESLKKRGYRRCRDTGDYVVTNWEHNDKVYHKSYKLVKKHVDSTKPIKWERWERIGYHTLIIGGRAHGKVELHDFVGNYGWDGDKGDYVPVIKRKNITTETGDVSLCEWLVAVEFPIVVMPRGNDKWMDFGMHHSGRFFLSFDPNAKTLKDRSTGDETYSWNEIDRVSEVLLETTFRAFREQ
jgi:hypothetical protein